MHNNLPKISLFFKLIQIFAKFIVYKIRYILIYSYKIRTIRLTMNLFRKLMIHTNNIFSKLLINSCGRQQVLKCEGNVDQMLRLRSLRSYIMSLYIV